MQIDAVLKDIKSTALVNIYKYKKTGKKYLPTLPIMHNILQDYI